MCLIVFQDANECWVQLVKCLQMNLKQPGKSVRLSISLPASPSVYPSVCLPRWYCVFMVMGLSASAFVWLVVGLRSSSLWIDLLILLIAVRCQKSLIDEYMQIEFAQTMRCVESEEEPATSMKEKVYQMSCFIDKDVKYLQTGLQNVRYWLPSLSSSPSHKVLYSKTERKKIKNEKK